MQMLGQPSKITMLFILFSMALYLFLMSFIHFPVTTLLKPLPIILLMLFTLEVQAKGQKRALLLGALGFSVIGDIVLTLPLSFALQVGILAFMAAHSLYICLYVKNMQFQRRHFLLFLPILVFSSVAFYYLWPYLGNMQIPVMVYICLLILMVFFAFQVKQKVFLIGGGATLFLLSDFTLSLDLFVIPQIKFIAVLVMFLYYLAQLLIVVGITSIKPADLIKKL